MLLVPYLISVHGWNGTERMFSQLQVPWPSHWAISTSHGHIKSIMDTVFNFNSIVALFRKLRFNNASYFVYYKLLTMLGILLTFFFFLAAADLWKVAFGSQRWHPVHKVYLIEFISLNYKRIKLGFKISLSSSHLCIAFYDFEAF